MNYMFEIELIASKAEYERFVSTMSSAGYDISETHSTLCSKRYRINPGIDNLLEANARANEIIGKIKTAAEGLEILTLEQTSRQSPEIKAREQEFLKHMQH